MTNSCVPEALIQKDAEKMITATKKGMKIFYPQVLQALPRSKESILWVCHGSLRGDWMIPENYSKTRLKDEMNTSEQNPM